MADDKTVNVPAIISGGAEAFTGKAQTTLSNPYNTYPVGDVNNDKYINFTDARLILQYEAGLVPFSKWQEAAANYSAYYKSWTYNDLSMVDYIADSTDARMLLQCETGIMEKGFNFPRPKDSPPEVLSAAAYEAKNLTADTSSTT